MRRLMEKKEPALQDKVEANGAAGRRIEFAAFLLLSVVGRVGSFFVNWGFPVSDSLILILFGAGIFATVVLVNIEGFVLFSIMKLPGRRAGLAAHAGPKATAEWVLPFFFPFLFLSAITPRKRAQEFLAHPRFSH
jgi:hypothetical protein